MSRIKFRTTTGRRLARIGLVAAAGRVGLAAHVAARWVQAARDNLTKLVHRRLGERLDLPVDQLSDLLPLVESRLELSLDRLLRSRVTEP